MGRFSIVGCLLLGTLMPFPRLTHAADREVFAVAAVYSEVAKDYQRKKNSDGSFRPEHYIISLGGQVKGTETDETVDRVQARDLVELLRQHLATQNYLLAPDTKSAELLLRVNWGRTVPFSGDINFSTATDNVAQALTNMSSFGGIGDDGYVSQEESAGAAAAASALESAMVMISAENRRRELANRFNAGLLGYRQEMDAWAGSPALFSAASDRQYELRDDIEGARYYILVFAYDRRSVTEKHQPQLQWVTRISISAPGNRFDENLAAMVARAGRYFGRDSGGLVRRYEGTVELGEPQVIGIVEEDAGQTQAKENASAEAESEREP